MRRLVLFGSALPLLACTRGAPDLSEAMERALADRHLQIGAGRADSGAIALDAAHGEFVYAERYVARIHAQTGAVGVVRSNPRAGLGLIPLPGVFDRREAMQRGFRVVQPAANHPAAFVHTPLRDQLKEDIVLTRAIGDRLALEWELAIDGAARASLDATGGVAIVGPAAEGPASRASGERLPAGERLLFRIPAPVVREASGHTPAGAARFELDGSRLRLVASGLSRLAYPIAIDPTVVVTTTVDFALGGNDEGTVDIAGDQVRRAKTRRGVGTWTSAGTLPSERYGHASVAYNGFLYALGGRGVGSPLNEVVVAPINVNGTLGAFAATTALPTGRDYLAAVAYNGYLYAIGGSGPGGPLTEVLFASIKADGTVGTWNATTTLPVGRYGLSGAAHDGFLYALGGRDGNGIVAEVLVAPVRADGTVGAWTSTTPFNTGRYWFASAAYDGFLFVLGGCTAGSNINCSANAGDVQVARIQADGTVGAWIATVPFATPRHRHTAVASAGHLYVLGGWDGGPSRLNDVQVAPVFGNGSVGTWTTSASFTPGRMGHTSVAVGGYLFVIGGWALAPLAGVRVAAVSTVSNYGDTGSWTATVPFATPRFAHASARYSGYVYVIGGCVAGGVTCSSYANDIQYAPIQANGTVGGWTTSGSTLAGGRQGHAAVAHNGRLYLLGGCNGGGNPCNTFTSEILVAPINANGDVGTFTANPVALPTPRAFHGAVVHGGYLYVVGGVNGSGVAATLYNDVQAAPFNADGTLGAFAPTQGFSGARHSHATVAYNGYLYVVGGNNNFAKLPDTQYAAFGAGGTVGAWTTSTTTFIEARFRHTGTAYAGYLYVLGGYGAASVYLADVQYAPILASGTLGAWATATTAIPTGRYQHSTVERNGFVYVLGGYSGAFRNDVQVALLRTPRPRAVYSKLVDVGPSATSVDSITVNGNTASLGAVGLSYRTAPATGVLGAGVNKGRIALGSPVSLAAPGVRYLFVRFTLDDAYSALVDATAANERDVTDFTINYTGAGAPVASQLAFTSPPRTFVAGACPGGTNAITVQLQDSFGAPVNAGAGGQAFMLSSTSTGTVNWYTDSGCSVAAGGGGFTIASGTNFTNVYYTDTKAGAPQVNASNASGLTNPSPQAHSVLPASAAALIKISGDNQTGTVGNPLGSPFVVQVHDLYGNPVSGTPVTFAVATGGGSIAPSSAVSAADGTASATGTVGTAAGTNNNTYTALATGLAGSPQTFTASATPGAGAALVKVSGDGQNGTFGSTLTSPFVVQVTDGFGNGVGGISVSWAATSGGGSIAPTSSTTDAAGKTQANGTLGATAGTNTYTATSGTLSGSPQTFTATGQPAAAFQLAKVSGDGQTGMVGTALALVLKAKTTDSLGNAVSAVTVTFAVGSGGGSVAPASAATDAAGEVSTVATLGTVAGSNSFTASAAVATGSPQTFTATGTAADAAALVKVSGDNQTGTVGTALANSFVVRVNDAYGNPVAGKTATFAVVSGGGSITSSSAVSAADGTVRAIGTLGTTAGTDNNTYTASAAGLSGSPQTFTASATPGAAAALVKVSGDNQTGAVNQALASPLVVEVRDTFGNPVSGATVTFSVPGGGGSVLPATAATGPSGQAWTRATLGTGAGPHTFAASALVSSGSPQTFTATATADVAAELVRVSGDGQVGTVGAALAQPLVVQAVDRYQNPIAGVSVAFAPAAGGGSVSPTTAATDSTGHAQTLATLGTAAGGQTFSADAPGLTGSPVGFGARAEPGPAQRIVVLASPPSFAAGASSTLSATVEDSYANPVVAFGQPIAFSLTSGPGGTFSPKGPVAPTAGSANVTFSSTLAGIDRVTASSAGLPDGTTIVAVVAGPTRSLRVEGIPSPIDAGAAADVTVTALDAWGNGVADYRGKIGFSATDPSAILPPVSTFAAGDAGRRTWPGGVRLYSAGTHSVSAGDVAAPTIAGTQSGIVVNAQVAPRIARDANPKAAVGVPYAYNPTGAITLALGSLPVWFDRCDGPTGFRVDPVSGAVRWTPSAATTLALCVLARNGFGEDVYRFMVAVENRSPTAVVAAFDAQPPSGGAPLAVDFDASRSTADPGALPLAFRWQFGDGSPPATGTAVQHVYGLPGGYRARLLAVDAFGAHDEAEAPIDVLDRLGRSPPHARIVASALEGKDSLTVDLSCDCTGSRPITAYRWDLGEGTVSTAATARPTYGPGRYHVRLTVVDAAGLWAGDEVEVVVWAGDREPPECLASADPPAGVAPVRVAFRGFAAAASGAIRRAAWQFGADDVVETRVVVRDYAEPGRREARFAVEDDGGLTCTDTVAVAVLSAGGGIGPHLVSEPPREAACGQPYRYVPAAEGVSVEGDARWTAVDGPAGISVDEATGEVTWTPTPSQTGGQSIALRVETGPGDDEHRFNVEVTCPERLSFHTTCGCAAGTGPTPAVLAGLAAIGARRRRRGRVRSR